MGAKVQCENYFQVLFPNKNAKPGAGTKSSILDAWPDYVGEATLKENQFYSTFKQEIMEQCSEKDKEMLKLTMLKHEEIFRDQVRELHRLYQMQKRLMAELKRKDSNTSTLTCGPVHDGPFASHVGSGPLKSEGKSNFWGVLNNPMTNKDSRDNRQPISGVDYMQIYRPSLFEQNLQIDLTEEGRQSPRDFYNLQHGRARKRTFDLEQPADENMDDEVTNKNEEADTLKRAVKDNIREPISLNDQSSVESESEVQLTLTTGCGMSARENGRQTGTSIQPTVPEISKEDAKEHKQLRYPEEVLLFPATSARSESVTKETVGKQRPVLSNQSFSRGPFNFDQEYRKNAEWPAVSGAMLFQDQRKSRYSRPKEGIFPGTVPQQRNTVFALVSSKGLGVDLSSASITGSLLGVPSGVITNSQRELHPSEFWRKAEDSFCHFPHGVHSQDYYISPAKTNPQVQDFDLQDKYHAQPLVIPGSNSMNVKRKASELGTGTWYQNGNLVQHGRQDLQSIYHSGNPSIFGQALCQTAPIVGSKTSQQQGAFHVSSSSDPSSSSLPSCSLQECSRSLLPTTFIELSPPQCLEGQGDIHSQTGKEVDLTLGLSSGVIEESRKDMHFSSNANKMEDAFSNNNGQFKVTNKNMHQESLHLNGDVQRGKCFTRSFLELPYVKETERASVKNVSQDNGLDFSDLLKSSAEGMQSRTGNGVISTKHLVDNLGGRGILPSKEKTCFTSDLLKVHDIANGTKDVKYDASLTVEGGILKPENILGIVEKTMNNSSAVWEISGNNQELRTGKNHVDGNLYTSTDWHELKIETFKENIDATYAPRKEELGVDSSKQIFDTEFFFLPPAKEHVDKKLSEGPCLALGTKAKRNSLEVSRQAEMEDRFTSRTCVKDVDTHENSCANPLSGTYKVNLQQSEHEADLEKNRYLGVQRSSGSKFEPEVDTSQINTTEGPSCSSPFVESERIGNSASRDLSVNTDAANILLKIASEKSSDKLGLDSCEFHFASDVKQSLDWFADVAVSSADHLEFMRIGHVAEADNPSSSAKSGCKAKESEVSEDSVPKENSCSPHASNGLDFFESMTLMLEEINVDVDCKPFAKYEKEAEKPPSPVNPILRPSKRGKPRRDFQREILPSISSLSRQEITEDIQIIGGLIRSTGDAWHTGCTRRSSGKFSMRDEWHVPQTGRRSRCTTGPRANGGNTKRNVDIQTARHCDQVVERLNTLSWTTSWGDTIRRRRMHRPRASIALNPI